MSDPGIAAPYLIILVLFRFVWVTQAIASPAFAEAELRLRAGREAQTFSIISSD